MNIIKYKNYLTWFDTSVFIVYCKMTAVTRVEIIRGWSAELLVNIYSKSLIHHKLLEGVSTDKRIDVYFHVCGVSYYVIMQ